MAWTQKEKGLFMDLIELQNVVISQLPRGPEKDEARRMANELYAKFREIV